MWYWIIAIIVGYLLGSIPVGFLVVRLVKGVDVRQVGSGRTGGANVLRAAGWQVALLSGAGDVLKGTLAVLLARWLGGPPLLQAIAGVAAVAGHNYPVTLSLQGGAGTATAIGGAIALWFWSGVLLLPVLFGVILSTHRASLGSIAVACLLPCVFVLRALLGAGPWVHLVHGVLTSVLVLWSLRPNIRRLLRREERQISWEQVEGQD
jgi:glycerol-3-phosphate acyltransferase PlsY